LGDVGAGVALNVGGVGGIKSVLRFDDLSWDDNFTGSNNDLV